MTALAIGIVLSVGGNDVDPHSIRKGRPSKSDPDLSVPPPAPEPIPTPAPEPEPVLPVAETGEGRIVFADLDGTFAIEIVAPADRAGLYETSLDGTALATQTLADGPLWIAAPQIVLSHDADGSGRASPGDTIDIVLGIVVHDADGPAFETRLELLAGETVIASPIAPGSFLLPQAAATGPLALRQTLIQEGRDPVSQMSQAIEVDIPAEITPPAPDLSVPPPAPEPEPIPTPAPEPEPVLPVAETGEGRIVFADLDGTFAIEIVAPADRAGLYETSLDGTALATQTLADGPLWIAAPQIVLSHDADGSGRASPGDTIDIVLGIVVHDADGPAFETRLELLAGETVIASPIAPGSFLLPQAAATGPLALRQTLIQEGRDPVSQMSQAIEVDIPAEITPPAPDLSVPPPAPEPEPIPTPAPEPEPVLPVAETGEGRIVFADLDGTFAIEIVAPADRAGLYETSLDGTALATQTLADGPLWIAAPQIVLSHDADGSGRASPGDTIDIVLGIVVHDADGPAFETRLELLAGETVIASPIAPGSFLLPQAAATGPLALRQTLIQEGRDPVSQMSQAIEVDIPAEITPPAPDLSVPPPAPEPEPIPTPAPEPEPVLPVAETGEGRIVFADLDGTFAIEIVAPADRAGLYETSLDGTALATQTLADGPLWIAAPQIVLSHDADGSGRASPGDTIDIVLGIVVHDADGPAFETRLELLAGETVIASPIAPGSFLLPQAAATGPLALRQTLIQEGRDPVSQMSQAIAA
ncbi:hypothetical protein [Palleronia sp. LCG004]|uniref:hypothetical protein n=1 Tax=Palleronia sp. LCG004 TaxID=3079304 RepID=UPI00294223C8|nr:hypothetical protein [Palleronia sp. LCG004]WOI58399.1 hypothetical protein RVY76_18630 [Palleronia sp. LCG004]